MGINRINLASQKLIQIPILFFLFSVSSVFAQQKSEKLELADEYFKRENYEKALELYEDLKGNPATDKRLFSNYLTCLDKLKPTKAEAAS